MKDIININEMQPIKHTFKKGEIIKWTEEVGTSIELSQKVKHIYFCPKDGDYFICVCKETRTPPYCDGSHLKIKE